MTPEPIPESTRFGVDLVIGSSPYPVLALQEQRSNSMVRKSVVPAIFTGCIAVVLSGLSQQLSAAAHDPAHKSQKNEECPLHAQHMKDQAAEDEEFKAMNERGARSMGFDQYKTTHHFRRLDNGGAIEVTVNNESDQTNLDGIRKHLRKVAKEFSEGNFSAPLATHNELPPGTAEMGVMKAKITYSYEELPNGARVRIATADADALHAIHQFFDYQIREHRTAD